MNHSWHGHHGARRSGNWNVYIRRLRPPAAGSDEGAWSAYREYLSDLQSKVTIAKAWLDDYERYGAVRRYFERLAARYERAAIRPWRGVEAEACGAK